MDSRSHTVCISNVPIVHPGEGLNSELESSFDNLVTEQSSYNTWHAVRNNFTALSLSPVLGSFIKNARAVNADY